MERDSSWIEQIQSAPLITQNFFANFLALAIANVDQELATEFGRDRVNS